MGSVSKGKYHEQSVALKVLYKARNNEVSEAFHLYPFDANLFARIRAGRIFVEKPLHGGHSHISLSCLS